VLDLSPTALALARQRLGAMASHGTWLAGSILDAQLGASVYAVWHDRAVFHFLTDHGNHARYVAQTRHAVWPGGHAIVASFSPEGPAKCSGLDVARYSPEGMHAEFGAGFRLLDGVREGGGGHSGLRLLPLLRGRLRVWADLQDGRTAPPKEGDYA
jgi:hypothetical protein